MTEEVKTHRLIFKFGASWCGPCKKVAPDFAKLQERYPKVSVMDMDLDENDDVAKQYGIEKIPAFVPFYRGKVLRDHIYIGSNLKKIEALFEYLMNKHGEKHVEK